MFTKCDNIIPMDDKKPNRFGKDADLSTIGGRLRFAREEAGLSVTELATLCGWDAGKNKGKSRISNYENNIRTPGPEDTQKMCVATGFPPTWVTYGGLVPINASLHPTRYPIPILSLSEAVNFAGMEAPKKTERYYMDQKDYENCYGVRVENDTMGPKFKKGDLLVIDPHRNPANGNFVLAHENGAPESMFKEYVIDGRDCYLRSINKDTPTRKMDAIHKILGVIVKKIPPAESLV